MRRSETRGAEAVAADLQALLADTQAACDEYGVCFLATDADDDGGKLILTAGAPTITGNDEERILLALRKIADGERAIPVRIGVNRGSVFAGDIGPWYRRTYTVMGDAVNLAARLMAKAEPGQIYATADVLETSGTRFATVELEPFMVKGKAKPVQAWAVGDAIGSRTRDASVQLPLIGRDEELAMLRAALADAEAGHGSMIELVGEPGIGKTPADRGAAGRLRGSRGLLATAEAFTSSSPVHRLARAAARRPGRRLGGRRRDGHPSFAGGDPSRPWPRAVAAARRDRRGRRHADDAAGGAACRGIPPGEAARGDGPVPGARRSPTPTLIHIEDAHQMDGSSGDLFALPGARYRGTSVAVSLTRREAEDGGSPRPSTIGRAASTLEPLDRAGVDALVEAATEDAPLPAARHLARGRARRREPAVRARPRAGGRRRRHAAASIETAAMARIDALAPGGSRAGAARIGARCAFHRALPRGGARRGRAASRRRDVGAAGGVLRGGR